MSCRIQHGRSIAAVGTSSAEERVRAQELLDAQDKAEQLFDEIERRGMIRADDPQGLTAALRALPQRDDLIAIAYVDTRSPDGAWRKYRVLAIDGVLYPLHLAIAHRWDVHYFSSEMFDRADYRLEEERFLANPRLTLGTRAWDALGRVRDELGLDYAGIDFGLDPQRNVLVYEANAAMAFYLPDDDPRFENVLAAASETLPDKDYTLPDY